jgi:hypothetical protein
MPSETPDSLDLCAVLVGWLADDAKMTTLGAIFIVEIEQTVPKNSFLRSVYDNHEQRVESASTYENLVKPIKCIPIHVVNVVDAWQPE